MATLSKGTSLIDRWRSVWQKTRFWLSVLVGLFFLWLAFRDVSLAKTLALFSRVNYIYLALALVALIASGMAKAWRWRLLFYPDENMLRFGVVWRILMIGQMINIVVPARFGELTRVYLVSETGGQSAAKALGTIGVEKLVDVSVLVLLTAVLPLFMPLPEWLWGPSRALAVIGIIALVVLFGVAYYREVLTRVVARLVPYLPIAYRAAILGQVERVLDSLSALRHGRVNLKLWFWSAIVWLVSSSVNYLVFVALGLSLPFVAAVFLLLVLHVGIAVPSSPGRIGVFHYLCVLALSVFSVDHSSALGYGMVLYILVFVPPSLLGLVFLAHDENLTWWRLRQAVQRRWANLSQPLPEPPK